MTKREFAQLNKAMRFFMADEPRDKKETADFEGGFLDAMDILDDLRRKHQRHSRRMKEGKG